MSKFSDEAADYDLILLGQTDAAWKVCQDLGEDDVWLPKSQCEMHPPNTKHGSSASFTVPNWLAEEKGLC
jgi:hypothetical protein